MINRRSRISEIAQEDDTNTNSYDSLEDEPEQQSRPIATRHRRETVLMEIRNYFGQIIRFQANEIRIISRKNQILITVAFILAAMVLLTWISSCNQCDSLEGGTKQIEKYCLSKKQQLNCNSIDKKANINWQMCQKYNQCLRDPSIYKQNLAKLRWEDIQNQISQILQFGQHNFWLFCILLLIGSLANYFRVQ